MKLSQEAINFFEHLATNAHHQIVMDELIANQSSEFKEIYSSKNSESVRNQFNSIGYLADTTKVTEK